MKKILTAGLMLFTLSVPLACGKVYNSSSYDASTYGRTTGGTDQFVAAKAIITESCANCHTRTSHQAWAGMSEEDFVSQNLITGGSLENSVLYTKIQGNRTSTPGNMPEGGSLLTSEQLDTLEAWIMSVAP